MVEEFQGWDMSGNRRRCLPRFMSHLMKLEGGEGDYGPGGDVWEWPQVLR